MTKEHSVLLRTELITVPLRILYSSGKTTVDLLKQLREQCCAALSVFEADPPPGSLCLGRSCGSCPAHSCHVFLTRPLSIFQDPYSWRMFNSLYTCFCDQNCCKVYCDLLLVCSAWHLLYVWNVSLFKLRVWWQRLSYALQILKSLKANCRCVILG